LLLVLLQRKFHECSLTSSDEVPERALGVAVFLNQDKWRGPSSVVLINQSAAAARCAVLTGFDACDEWLSKSHLDRMGTGGGRF
jgi:hypothetical protein